MRKELYSVNILRQFRQSQINKFHLFLAPQADCSHQSLQEPASSFFSQVQRSDEYTVKDLQSFQSSRQTEESDERKQVFKIVDDRGSYKVSAVICQTDRGILTCEDPSRLC